MFAAIRRGDVLLHHPYENFSSVVDFLRQASADPKVLAIKQTLYRTGGDLQIVSALMDAVRNGKQVTAVVELKGRSEDGANVLWARRLEQEGVHVVYGFVNCKVHAKLCLVVRKDDDAIRRYLHLSTGNYNTANARVYEDLGLLTCRPDFGEDATNLFNLLTGVCQFPGSKKLVVAPFDLHGKILELIQRETLHARQELPARIIAKMNALEDPHIIDALCQAAQAGVRIDLIVRGRLLPASAGRRPEPEHHRAQHRGPLSGAQPHLLFRKRLPAGSLGSAAPTGRPSSPPPHRGDLSHRGRQFARAHPRPDFGGHAVRQRQGPVFATQRRLHAPAPARARRAAQPEPSCCTRRRPGRTLRLPRPKPRPKYPRLKLAPSPFA